jgi:hypothetical protein
MTQERTSELEDMSRQTYKTEKQQKKIGTSDSENKQDDSISLIMKEMLIKTTEYYFYYLQRLVWQNTKRKFKRIFLNVSYTSKT